MCGIVSVNIVESYTFVGLFQNVGFEATPFRCVRMSNMQDAADEDDRSLPT